MSSKQTQYHADTPKELIALLERLRKNGKIVRVHFGDRETGLDWNEENDVKGRIDRSTGDKPIPLLVEEGEIGGGALLDHCIVLVRDGGRILWKHPKYHSRSFSIGVGTLKEYPIDVMRDGEIHARFKKIEDAYAYLADMVVTI